MLLLGRADHEGGRVAQSATVWVSFTCFDLACWQLLAGNSLGRCMPKGGLGMLPPWLRQ